VKLSAEKIRKSVDEHMLQWQKNSRYAPTHTGAWCSYPNCLMDLQSYLGAFCLSWTASLNYWTLNPKQLLVACASSCNMILFPLLAQIIQSLTFTGINAKLRKVHLTTPKHL
jgi:hypothetical protein